MLWVLISGASNDYPKQMLLWRSKKSINTFWIEKKEHHIKSYIQQSFPLHSPTRTILTLNLCFIHLTPQVLVVWTLDFGCRDVGFWLWGRCILVMWSLDFGCRDVGFWLCGRWILVSGRRIMVVGTLDFGCDEVGYWLCRRQTDVRM